MANTDKKRRLSTKEEILERESLVLTKRPFTTLKFFILELVNLLVSSGKWLITEGFVLCVLGLLGVFAYHWGQTAYPSEVDTLTNVAYMVYYWVVLGILSSVGLGSGLHTFLIFVLPYIGYVSKKMYRCGNADFSFPPLVGLQVVVPTGTHMHAWHQWYLNTPCSGVADDDVTLMDVVNVLRLPVVLWGIGTAIGELPPYFVARAARLSEVHDEAVDELHESLSDTGSSLLSRAKRFVHTLVNKMGFIGIMLCASIPNPLFDLAGLTCGHFLIPFSTFFGATAIGKGLIKTHLQLFACVLLMSETFSKALAKWALNVPVFGEQISGVILRQSAVYAQELDTEVVQEQQTANSLFSIFLTTVVVSMVAYFLASIISHLAQRYHKRHFDDKKQNKTQKKNN